MHIHAHTMNGFALLPSLLSDPRDSNPGSESTLDKHSHGAVS